jgi:hypothetical protein
MTTDRQSIAPIIEIETVMLKHDLPLLGANAMSSGSTAWFAVSLVPLFLLVASCENSGCDKTPTRYQSPKAVFDAYREAQGKREWRKVFSLLTPEMQNDAAFESFFACMEQGSKEMGPIVPQYVEVATLNEDYQRQYKKKHGIDLAKVEQGHENDPTFVPPPLDEQLWRDVLAAHIKDKAGFCEAVAKHFDERNAKRHEVDPIMPLGDLEHLVVNDDTATGSAKKTILPRPGESPLKPGQAPPIYEKPFKFRRINGEWLLDSM